MLARPLIAALSIAAVLLAGGCGLKGPLYLPDKNKSAVAPPAAAPAPAPAMAPVQDKDSRDKDSDNSGS